MAKKYHIELDKTKQVFLWSEYDRWGYVEAKQRTDEIIQMAQSLNHPWAFLIKNEKTVNSMNCIEHY